MENRDSNARHREPGTVWRAREQTLERPILTEPGAEHNGSPQSLPQSSCASRFTAGAAGFLHL
ncbi:MAG TPA: hypothetical protein VGF06_14045, partial [Terriglobales bacterium]